MTDGASVVAGEVLVLDMVDQGGFGGAYLSTGHTLVGVLLSSPDTIFNILSPSGCPDADRAGEVCPPGGGEGDSRPALSGRGEFRWRQD